MRWPEWELKTVSFKLILVTLEALKLNKFSKVTLTTIYVCE